MPSFRHNSIECFYDTVGEGPPILFQHGLGADRAQGLAAIADVVGHRVITMDMPGHGETMGVSGKYGFEAFTDAAIGLMDHLELDEAVAGGISMGSGIALAMALRVPERVRALLLVRPAWLDENSPSNLEIIREMGVWMEESGLESARERLLEHPLYVEALGTNPSCAASLAGALTTPHAMESAEVLRVMVDDRPIRSMADLARLSQSTLVIGNDGDPLHPAEMARAIATAIPNARHAHVPSRYLETVAHQKALTEEIQAFLGGLVS